MFTVTKDTNGSYSVYVDGVLDVGPANSGVQQVDFYGNNSTLEYLWETNFYYTTNVYPSAGVSNPPPNGFVQWVFARNGVRLPREVREQYDAGRKIDLREVQPGDLLFFETVSRGASHVGLAIGGDEFVHAPSSKGVVRVEKFTTTYWAKRFVGARRVATTDTKTN